jgi:hypothetical protein
MAKPTPATTEQPALGAGETPRGASEPPTERKQDTPQGHSRRIRYLVCTRCGKPVRLDSPSCGWCGQLRGRSPV